MKQNVFSHRKELIRERCSETSDFAGWRYQAWKIRYCGTASRGGSLEEQERIQEADVPCLPCRSVYL